MAQGLIGVNGVHRNISEVKVGANGVRNVTNMYVGVNGSPRLCWSGNKWANKMYVVCYTPDVNYVGLYIYDPLTSARTLVKSIPKTDRVSAFAQNFVEKHPMGGIKYFYGWTYSNVLSQIDPSTYAVTQQVTIPGARIYWLNWGLRSILITRDDGRNYMQQYDPKTLAWISDTSKWLTGTGYSSDSTIFSDSSAAPNRRNISKTVFTKIPEPSVFTTDPNYITEVASGTAMSGTGVTEGKHYLVYNHINYLYDAVVSTYDTNTRALISRFDKPFALHYADQSLFDFMKE